MDSSPGVGADDPGQLITDEINADPEEVKRLRESRRQANDARIRRLEELAAEIIEKDGELLKRLAQ